RGDHWSSPSQPVWKTARVKIFKPFGETTNGRPYRMRWFTGAYGMRHYGVAARPGRLSLQTLFISRTVEDACPYKLSLFYFLLNSLFFFFSSVNLF
ncbi:MAG: hypothetical protein IIX86_05200, partial [Clostridia bacterium]|nr:hypothetical protein [Clostridia bacterium]